MKNIVKILMLVLVHIQSVVSLQCHLCEASSKQACEGEQGLAKTCPESESAQCMTLTYRLGGRSRNERTVYRKACTGTVRGQCEWHCRIHNTFKRPCQVECCSENGCNNNKREEEKKNGFSARISNTANISGPCTLLVIFAATITIAQTIRQ